VQPAPIRIEPIFTPRIWGARSLAPLYPVKSNLSEPIGEAWLTGADCRIVDGPFAGKTLGAVWRELPAEWRGTRLASTPDFPILVKLIFPREKLSIQVHPDDAYAAAHEQAAGGRGKTEMWHAVSAEAGAQVLVGLKSGIDKQKFRESLSTNAAEDFFQAHAVHEGDTFFVPAGTPHTIGSDMVLCEVQQYSDLTYRLYDYGRVDSSGKARELHIEKAMDVIQFGRSIGGKVSPLQLPQAGAKKYLLAGCKYFATERWEFSGDLDFSPDAAHADIFVVLSGSGNFEIKNASTAYHSGETWLIPASIESMRLTPGEPTVFIRTFVPDLAKLRDNLSRAGLDQAKLSQVLFNQ
jgi:mannose-6-phosphate isomerase